MVTPKRTFENFVSYTSKQPPAKTQRKDENAPKEQNESEENKVDDHQALMQWM